MYAGKTENKEQKRPAAAQQATTSQAEYGECMPE